MLLALNRVKKISGLYTTADTFRFNGPSICVRLINKPLKWRLRTVFITLTMLHFVSCFSFYCRGLPFSYESGWKDWCCVFFYTLICIIMHALLQEYLIEVSECAIKSHKQQSADISTQLIDWLNLSQYSDFSNRKYRRNCIYPNLNWPVSMIRVSCWCSIWCRASGAWTSSFAKDTLVNCRCCGRISPIIRWSSCTNYFSSFNWRTTSTCCRNCTCKKWRKKTNNRKSFMPFAVFHLSHSLISWDSNVLHCSCWHCTMAMKLYRTYSNWSTYSIVTRNWPNCIWSTKPFS